VTIPVLHIDFRQQAPNGNTGMNVPKSDEKCDELAESLEDEASVLQRQRSTRGRAFKVGLSNEQKPAPYILAGTCFLG
jgi:hypothetical protein